MKREQEQKQELRSLARSSPARCARQEAEAPAPARPQVAGPPAPLCAMKGKTGRGQPLQLRLPTPLNSRLLPLHSLPIHSCAPNFRHLLYRCASTYGVHHAPPAVPCSAAVCEPAVRQCLCRPQGRPARP
ncbi:hypothetical protein ABB26_13170 [Stenotrophomonas humi]|uniref:Uncharacterized protein n=1 Tax=Stenotrophomonas humi TaxID=405444 RepID=A0A0R0CCU0_9GAMM|nr:hypothetical protein ABB26_13170 [Stenotrophomonas humi]